MIELRYANVVKLNEATSGTVLLITEVDVPQRNQLRMQELGIRVGAHATIIQRAGFGGLILNIAGSRVAVDHRSAKLISVDLLATSTPSKAEDTSSVAHQRAVGVSNPNKAEVTHQESVKEHA